MTTGTVDLGRHGRCEGEGAGGGLGGEGAEGGGTGGGGTRRMGRLYAPEKNPTFKTNKQYAEPCFLFTTKKIPVSKHGPFLDPKTRVHEPSQTVA